MTVGGRLAPAVVIAAFFAPLAVCAGTPDETPTRAVIEIAAEEGAARFTVEIADEPGEMARGLMNRDSLADNSGMLFLYDPPRPARFWMKNTRIPLDMIFIGTDSRIVKIAPDREPFSLEPVGAREPLVAVLEINGGLAARLGVAEGDRVYWVERPGPVE